MGFKRPEVRIFSLGPEKSREALENNASRLFLFLLNRLEQEKTNSYYRHRYRQNGDILSTYVFIHYHTRAMGERERLHGRVISRP